MLLIWSYPQHLSSQPHCSPTLNYTPVPRGIARKQASLFSLQGAFFSARRKIETIWEEVYQGSGTSARPLQTSRRSRPCTFPRAKKHSCPGPHNEEGARGFSVLRFCIFLNRFLVFFAVCGFPFCSTWFSVFVKNSNGFQIWYPMWFLSFPI